MTWLNLLIAGVGIVGVLLIVEGVRRWLDEIDRLRDIARAEWLEKQRRERGE
jgi:hypothetical protein